MVPCRGGGFWGLIVARGYEENIGGDRLLLAGRKGILPFCAGKRIIGLSSAAFYRDFDGRMGG